MSTELVPRVSRVVSTSTVRSLLPEGQQEATDLLDYQVTVSEPEDQITRLPATDTGTEDLEITVLPDRKSTSFVEQGTRKLQRLNKKKAKVLADRVAKAEAKKKKKISSRKNRYCKWCKLSCNSDKTFYDHNNSTKHKRTVENIRTDLNCDICKREFRCAADLASHNLNAKHIKATRALRDTKN